MSPALATNIRVLIVEDDRDVLRAFEQMMRSVGFSVVATSRPIEALERLVSGDRNFATLVIDVEMPEMRGPELVARLEDAGIAIPVLFLTGGTPPITTHRTLAKPVSARTLCEVIVDLAATKS